MKTLPQSNTTLLIRTDFSDQDAWETIRAAVGTPNEDGIDLWEEPRGEIRATATEFWSIENNLSLGNMDFHEFAEAVRGDGIFRGF